MLEPDWFEVDGQRRVGPSAAYALYSGSLIARAEDAVSDDVAHGRLTDDMREAVAGQALFVAMAALPLDHPVRGACRELIDSLLTHITKSATLTPMTNTNEFNKFKVMLTSPSQFGKGVPSNLRFMIDNLQADQQDNGKWLVRDARGSVVLARDLDHLEDVFAFIMGARFLMADA